MSQVACEMSCRAGTPGWGYKPSLSKSCTMKCEIANCSYCLSDNKCGACNSGYVLSSGKCVKKEIKCTVINCNKCNFDNFCSSCASGYDLKNGECVKNTDKKTYTCKRFRGYEYSGSCTCVKQKCTEYSYEGIEDGKPRQCVKYEDVSVKSGTCNSSQGCLCGIGYSIKSDNCKKTKIYNSPITVNTCTVCNSKNDICS